ncbi:MAG: arginine--tRNA ligase [Candidatus Helarchaeota archaeon]|nr:arginine--tRNA ligase [Candidatus Helarchaeota archaeon]
MENPWDHLQSQILTELERVLNKLDVDGITPEDLRNLIKEPRYSNLGDFETRVCFPLAKIMGRAPREIADMISNEIALEKLPYFSRLEVAGGGYINFFIDWEKFNTEILNQIIELKENFGNLSIGKGKKAIVEHTSPNPTKPIHMGTMRCAVLGDITGRILKKIGYKVEIENYMDDLGRQVAVLIWGFLNLFEKRFQVGKSDEEALYIDKRDLEIIKWEDYGRISVQFRLPSRKLKDYIAYALIMDYLSLKTEEMNISMGIKYLKRKVDVKLDHIERLQIEKRERQIKISKLNEALKELRLEKDIEVLKLHKHLRMKEKDEYLIVSIQNENLYKIKMRDFIEEKLKAFSNLRIKDDFMLGILYTQASQAIEKNPQLEEEIQDLIARLENGDPECKSVANNLVQLALEGQLETANRMNIFYDLLIWESDVIASGIFEETLTELLQSDKVYKVDKGEDKGCIVVDMSEFGEDYRQMEKPYKIIVRSNDVATYTGRDIGLHFFKMNLVKGKFKFRKWGTQPNGQDLWETSKEGNYMQRFGHGDLAINVIGYEQKYPQQVVNHALKITGHEKQYQNSHHLSFKWVWLPGQQAFSGRKGTWVGFEADAALNKAVELALEEVKKRHEEEFSRELMNQIAEIIGVGAVKYYLAKYSPEKKIVIEWKDVLNFEGESAPYVQYAYVRTQGIFRKHEGSIQNPNPSLLTHETEIELIRLIAKFPQLLQEVAENFAIHQIANYALLIADKFNDFYHQVPVLKAATPELKASRLQLVQAISILLRILLVDLLGIQVPDRM